MFFRPSGGLTYHFNAGRSATKDRWRPFQAKLQSWLEEWNPKSEELILIGPSGGYTLPTGFLKRFKQIHAFDLDPLAGFFFRRRHQSVPVKFYRRDVFRGDRGTRGLIGVQALDEVLREHPNAAILFSNLLGQLLLEKHVMDAEWDRFLAKLMKSVHGREFASYHDVYSMENLKLTHEVFKKFSEGRPFEKIRELGGRTVTDHMLKKAPWPSEAKRTFMNWELHPNSLHIIEAVSKA